MPYTFPTLSAAPRSCPDEPIDDTITSKSEGGYSQTRPRNTRQRRKLSPKYIMNETDWQAVKTFDGVVGGWSVFSWIHPTSGATLQGRFTSRPKADPIRIPTGFLYNVDFTFETA